tara:strand:+ start:71 stop:556 length:486 start_codon:yes stop_codon:yes gene_type:complete
MKLGMRKDEYGRTPFHQKWGINATQLAEQEKISTEALHMRVLNWGTPWRRKKVPTAFEVMYNKTRVELAKENNCTPQTISQRVEAHGSAYYTRADGKFQHNTGKRYVDQRWEDTRGYSKPNSWIHPKHPQFKTWRFHFINAMLNGASYEQAAEECLNAKVK